MRSKATQADEATRVVQVQGEMLEMVRTLRGLADRCGALQREMDATRAAKASRAAFKAPLDPESVRARSSLAYEIGGDFDIVVKEHFSDLIETLERGARRTEADCRRHDEQEHAQELARRKAAAA